MNVAFPSTITKLETALTSVSTVLIVSDKPNIIIINDKNSVWSLKSNEKNPKSGTTLGSTDIATRPQNPIKKTIGIITKNEINKLLTKILLFLAA